jgi:hypothetical protein
MAEESHESEKIEGGLYIKKENPIDISKASAGDVANLNEVSKRSGVEFPLDGDSNTITPQRLVAIGKRR